MSPPADVFPKAFDRVNGKQLLELARNSHPKTMQLSAGQTSGLPLTGGYRRGLNRLNVHES